MIFTLKRERQTPFSTAGELIDPTGAVMCATLERGANNPDHPRIICGQYEVQRKNIGESKFDNQLQRLLGPKYKGILWLPDVIGRTNIEVHPANFYTELLGCIALGRRSYTSGGEYMIVQSQEAYADIYPVISTSIDREQTFFDIRDLAQ